MLVTLQRHAKARGYFAPERFTGASRKRAVHELAMNPDSFTGRTDEAIMSTLAHEISTSASRGVKKTFENEGD